MLVTTANLSLGRNLSPLKYGPALAEAGSGASPDAFIAAGRDGLGLGLYSPWTLPRNVVSQQNKLDQVSQLLNGKSDKELIERLKSKGLLEVKDKNGDTLLDNVARLSSGPIIKDARGKEVDRAGLMRQILGDVDNVKNIYQGARNTCGATSSSIRLATEKPAEYARMLSELGRTGKAILPDGKGVAEVHKDALVDLGAGHKDESYRTVTGRLLQPALMDYANGSRVSYDDASERQRVANPLNSAAETVSKSVPLLGPILGKVIKGVGWFGNLLGFGKKETGAEQVRTITGSLPNPMLPGLAQVEMGKLNTALFGEKYKVLGSNLSLGELPKVLLPGQRPNYADVSKALDEGKVPMYALMDTDQKETPKGSKSFLSQFIPPFSDKRPLDPNADHMPAEGMHWVFIKKIENGRVFFEDPNRVSQAQLSPDAPAKGHPLEKRRQRPAGYQVDADGLASMPVESFKSSVWSLVVPEKK